MKKFNEFITEEVGFVGIQGSLEGFFESSVIKVSHPISMYELFNDVSFVILTHGGKVYEKYADDGQIIETSVEEFESNGLSLDQFTGQNNHNHIFEDLVRQVESDLHNLSGSSNTVKLYKDIIKLKDHIEMISFSDYEGTTLGDMYELHFKSL